MKQRLISLATTLVMLTLCLIGCGLSKVEGNIEQEAAAIFTLDVNPGVRIYVDKDNTVIGVEATNEDGETVVAELDLKGVDVEAAVEEIVDKMDEQGFLPEDANAVLMSVEKKLIDISEKVGAKIEKAFEKHGKTASIIEQELDKLDKAVQNEIDKMAEKYHISEGKAHLIEKIREEYPELSEEELAKLKVNELRMMLEDTSEEIKGHFKKLGKEIEDAYLGRMEAIATAIGSLEIDLTKVTMPRVRVTRDDGKMLYEVKFVYEDMEYEITLDAVTGEILESESEAYEPFDPDAFLEDFCDKHNVSIEDIKNQIMGGIFGDKWQGGNKEEPDVSRGEILKTVMTLLGITEESLEETEVSIHRGKEGIIVSVELETVAGDEYELVLEAASGTVLKAEMNGVELELSTGQ